jgi:hypothetical protein
MTRFYDQMKRLHDAEDDYNNIFANDDWELYDYKEFFYYIKKGYLVQGDYSEIYNNGFVINEEWDWDGYEEEDYEDI